MAAGNAIERSPKNISEYANIMLTESHFPYILLKNNGKKSTALFINKSKKLTKKMSFIRNL